MSVQAALETLVRLQSQARFAAAVEALKRDDFQLIRTAAIALRGTPEPERSETVNELFNTLKRLTADAADTSRDPRVAILERLGELLPVERTAELVPYRLDFDPRVREAATAALAKVTQTDPPAVTSGINTRYPYQPVQEMARLAQVAIITMEGGGTIDLELFVHDAPVTVARFAELARAGYYDGLTFHRVVPNFVIQGGSPGANEYAGTARYMRDEVGTQPHLQGRSESRRAVAIRATGRSSLTSWTSLDSTMSTPCSPESPVGSMSFSGSSKGRKLPRCPSSRRCQFFSLPSFQASRLLET